MTHICLGCHEGRLRAYNFHGEHVDCCRQCGGLWFKNGELNAALSKADNGDDDVRVEETLGELLGSSSRSCHQCDLSLHRYHLMTGYEIEVDVCHSCSGVWVDEHERTKVVQSPKVRQLLEELNASISVKTWLFQFLCKMPVEFNLKPKSTPLVTYMLLALNILIFVAYGFNLSSTETVFENFAMRSNELLAGHHPWTLLSHMFLHGDIMHLAGNMYFLYVVGDNLEDVLGRAKFLGLYLLCGLAAAAAQIAADPGSGIYMVGASGAIAGLFGMYLMWFRHASLTFMFVVYQKKLSPMAFFAIWLGFNIFGLVMAGQGVAYWAHIGGFVMGLILGVSLKAKVMHDNPMLALLNEPEVKIAR
ncbi:rhomboid family intramembrane serine protease [Shewanella sp. Isolate8]|uniref:rhomboid family intramembrane serine protease n=1 Tax=Shewanella sp. Isolate8 TaxID=2908529 RepID=UPI001EFD05DB|nr:rhomboid family intramembrane serine protease [Shewanella sp. Isolate8]MCG9747687.1 rhomboid family intramembrane serine protease [Shewanella sp. Isolate8]